MSLQKLFLIVLLPIVFYEILTAYFKQVSPNKRIVYKTITGFSFFVLAQLSFLIFEDTLLNQGDHFPIWGLFFLFYGPYLNLILSTWLIDIQKEKYNRSLGDFYCMMCVFICCVFVLFLKPDLPYVSEVIGIILGISSIYYGIILGLKLTKITSETLMEHELVKGSRSSKWLHISLSFVLVIFFFSISQDLKLSGLLFLFLWYVSLVFLRKNLEEKNTELHRQVERETRGIAEDEEMDDNWQNEEEAEEEEFDDNGDLEHYKYGQTKLNEIVLQRCSIKVKDIIIEKKAFLDANFKMTDLAAQTKISRYYLAQYFNVVHQMNFREYINKLRIDHVVQYINDCKKKEKLSVNDLFLESAFNSKTSFFKSFKHVLGCTPFEYLKKCQD